MASYTPVTNKLNFSVGFNPTSAFPLDVRTMFGSLTEAQAAAASAVNAGSSDSAYYYGMILTVFENDVATHYSIQGDNTLKEVGKSVAGDDKTIVLSGEVLTLKSFGIEYYAYVAATETEEAHYVKTEGWKEGLSPQVIKNSDGTYELAWYEPSTTTVEGLQKAVTSLQKSVADVQTEADTNKENIATLRTDVNEAQADITTFKGDETVEGSIEYKVNSAIAKMLEDAPEAFDTLKEIADWCSNHSQEVTQMQSDINTNKTNIANLETLVGKLPSTATSKTVVDYIAEAIKNADDAKKFGDIITHNVAEFATAAQGAKADTAVQKVEASTNGHISVDSKDVKVYEAPIASATTVGDVKVDGTSITADAEGKISVEAVDAAKITGLQEKIDAAKTAAVEESESYADDKFVWKTNIATAVSDTPSDEKVISEKAISDLFTWKTTM